MTPLTDELLLRRLTERAERGPAMSLAAIARSVVAQPRRRAPIASGRAAVLGPIAAVFVLAAVVAGGLLNRASTQPVVSVPPAPSSIRGSNMPGSAPPSSTASGPDTLATWASLTWEKTSPVPFESDETIVNDAIAVGDGFIAVGTTQGVRGGTLTGHVWRSVDGRVWERIDDPGIATFVPSRVMAIGATLVVLGDRRASEGDVDKNVELWRSVDGATWTRGPSLPVPGDAVSAVGGPAGILLPVGHRTFVIGPDLDAWTETTTWPAGVFLGSPAWADGRWIQPGATGVTGANAPTTATVWTSSDGRTWTAGTMAPSSGAVFDVYPAAEGFVAIGQSENLCLLCYGPLIQRRTAWWSADGTSWSGIDLHLGPGGTQFAGDGRRLLSVAGPVQPGKGAAAPASISATVDGRTWTPIAFGDPSPDATGFAGRMVVGSRGVAILPGNVIDRSTGAFVPQAWWGAATPAPTTATVPVVVGCDTLGFDARRCAAVIARARQQAGNPLNVVMIAIKQAKLDTSSAGSHPVATVGFTVADGTTTTVEFRCLNIGNDSDLACSPDPQIYLQTGVSHDVPCGATPGDENHPCATPPPSPRPAVVSASEPLVLRTVDVPIDHVGHYEILVGSASLPDGLLSERSGALADSRPTAYWIDNGVQIVVRPGKPCIGSHCPEIDSIYHKPFHGPQPVHVYLVFDVIELDAPGTILEVRNLVVR